jgi:hypothetical protein
MRRLLPLALALHAAVLGAQDSARAPERLVSRRPAIVKAVVAREGPAADSAAELRRFFLSRESQLRFCYVEWGHRADSTLGGELRMHVVASGWRAESVTFESISATWRGAASVEAERCMRKRVASWRLPLPMTGLSRFEATLGLSAGLIRIGPASLPCAHARDGTTSCFLPASVDGFGVWAPFRF